MKDGMLTAEHLAQQALRLIDDAYGKSDERRNSTDLSELAASIRQRLSTEPGKHAKRGSFSVAYACAMIGLQPRTYFNWVKQIRNEADCVLAIKDKRTLERKGPSKDPKALSNGTLSSVDINSPMLDISLSRRLPSSCLMTLTRTTFAHVARLTVC